MSLPEHVSTVSDLAYSSDGAYLASADDNRRVTVFTSNDYEVGHMLLAYMRLCVDYYMYVTMYMHCRNLEWFLMECQKYSGNYFGFYFYYVLRLAE